MLVTIINRDESERKMTYTLSVNTQNGKVFNADERFTDYPETQRPEEFPFSMAPVKGAMSVEWWKELLHLP